MRVVGHTVLIYCFNIAAAIKYRRFTLREAARHLFFSSLKTNYNTVFFFLSTERAGDGMPLKHLSSESSRRREMRPGAGERGAKKSKC